MKKNGFTLVEIIISIGLILVIAVSAITFFVIDKKETYTFTFVEQTILESAQLLVNAEYDLEGSTYKEKLNLGSQGVQISLGKLLKEGLIDEKIVDSLYEELRKKDSSITKDVVLTYYILVLNGSVNESYNDDPCNGMLTYYLSWQEDLGDKEKIYLCGNLPKSGDSSETIKVKLEEASGYEIPTYYKPSLKLTDEDGNEVIPNGGKYALSYGKKYYIEFLLSREDPCFGSDTYETLGISAFNSDKNYIFITLEDVNNYKDGIEVIKYYNLNEYALYPKPSYNIKYLKDELNEVFADAKYAYEELNYNNVSGDGYYYDYEDAGKRKKTYFYRGNVNNYVSFAGYLWRIIRIDGEDSIRMILDGDIGSSDWSESNNMGEFEGSLVKSKLNEWFRNNLPANSYRFIAYTYFCNDTSTTTYISSGKTINNSYLRLANTSSSNNPTFVCDSSNEYWGNIGLITADEMVFAGASNKYPNFNYFLAYNNFFWTMTPYDTSSMFASSFVYSYEGEGGGELIYSPPGGYSDVVDTPWEEVLCENSPYWCEVTPSYMTRALNLNVLGNYSFKTSTTITSYNGIDNKLVIRPVISLMENVLIYDGGKGTYGNPYIVDEKYNDRIYMQGAQGGYLCDE